MSLEQEQEQDQLEKKEVARKRLVESSGNYWMCHLTFTFWCIMHKPPMQWWMKKKLFSVKYLKTLCLYVFLFPLSPSHLPGKHPTPISHIHIHPHPLHPRALSLSFLTYKIDLMKQILQTCSETILRTTTYCLFSDTIYRHSTLHTLLPTTIRGASSGLLGVVM